MRKELNFNELNKVAGGNRFPENPDGNYSYEIVSSSGKGPQLKDIRSEMRLAETAILDIHMITQDQLKRNQK